MSLGVCICINMFVCVFYVGIVRSVCVAMANLNSH